MVTDGLVSIAEAGDRNDSVYGQAARRAVCRACVRTACWACMGSTCTACPSRAYDGLCSDSLLGCMACMRTETRLGCMQPMGMGCACVDCPFGLHGPHVHCLPVRDV